MGLGWGTAYQIFFSLIPKDISWKVSQFIFWGIFLFSWLGAKILFYLTLPKNYPYDDLLTQISFWTGGGFVFYGGLLGGIIFLLVSQTAGIKLSLQLLWPILPSLTIGHGIGRLGCFLAGCCYGKPTTLAWGVFMHGFYRHPTQLLEAAGLLALGVYLVRAKQSKITLITVYLISYGSMRFFIELLRGDEIRGSWGFLSPSQWISLLLILMGMALFTNKNSSLVSKLK